MEAAHLLQAWGPLVGGVAVGLLPWLKLWRDAREAGGRRRADLIKIAQDAAAAVITELREEADRLRVRVGSLEDTVSGLRRELGLSADGIAARDAQIALLRARLVEALALAETYRRRLGETLT
jgi:hypothetical protein